MVSSLQLHAGNSRQDQILLVDDNPANLKILFETLDGRGYKLLVAESGDKAVSIAQKSPPDLILLDVMMPGMDGFEVCRKLKDSPLTARASIVFLSALDDTDSKVTGFDAGGVDFISKPFQVKEVIARVETHLKIHRLEQELGQRNKELQTDKSSILSTMSEGIYGLNQQGDIIFANPAACKMNDCHESELLGQNLVRLHFGYGHAVNRGSNSLGLETTAARLKKMLNDKQPFKVSHAQFLRPDGTIIPVAFHASSSTRPDTETHAVVVFHDISDEIAQELELAKARESIENQRSQLAHVSRLSMMGEMATGIAHEVNQPLTAAVNYVRLAIRLFNSDQTDRDVLANTLEKIEAQCLRASQVIQHIRDFVKKPRQGKDIVAGDKLVSDILELACIEAKELDIEIISEGNKCLPGLYVEEIQIQQVALNLIRNAMEATKSIKSRGIVRLVVTVSSAEKVRFEVIDEGPGVTEEVKRTLFSPFTSTKESGMGIGLTLCQSIVHSHGGEIGYMPAEQSGQGSIFYFTLPVLPPT